MTPAPLAPCASSLGTGTSAGRADFSTGREQLDLLTPATGAVWSGSAGLCFVYLKPGGFLRVAVPGANFPDPENQCTVHVGGPGPVSRSRRLDPRNRRGCLRFGSLILDAVRPLPAP